MPMCHPLYVPDNFSVKILLAPEFLWHLKVQSGASNQDCAMYSALGGEVLNTCLMLGTALCCITFP